MYRSHNPNAPGMHTADSHTRISYKEKPGIIQQIQGSLCASLLGIVLVFAAFPLLYWNEGRAVQTALSLDEGLREVISLQINEVRPENHDKLVHLMGELKTDKALSDPEYGVAVHAVKLKREVEMFQWVEHTSTKEYDDGGSIRQETTYSYSTEWRTDLVNSQSFDNPNGHQNPSSMPMRSYVNKAKQVEVGEFNLSPGLVDKISDFYRLNLRETNRGMAGVRVVDGTFYHSRDPYNPMVGDVRVSFSYAGYSGKPGSRLGEPMKVSIIARQHGDRLVHYHTKSGDPLELLYADHMTAKEMFEAEHSANTMLTWVLRGVGWLVMFIGFQLTASILTTLVSWLPLVRELVGLGVTLVCVCLATSLTLLTAAIGWIAHRPLLGMGLLVAAAVPIILSRRWNMQKLHQRKH